MARIVDLLDTIIPDNRKNEYWFLKFAQAKYLSDSKRDALREDLYRQDMPEKSLMLLYDTMVNLKGIVTDILKAEHLPYLTFTNLGQITERELRENAFFSPFKRELATEFDTIENQTVADVVKAIKDKETRKYTSLIMLYLFRMLRYLYIINSLVCRVVELFLAYGLTPPIYLSANVPGGDEHNRALAAKYRGRIRGL